MHPQEEQADVKELKDISVTDTANYFNPDIMEGFRHGRRPFFIVWLSVATMS